MESGFQPSVVTFDLTVCFRFLSEVSLPRTPMFIRRNSMENFVSPALFALLSFLLLRLLFRPVKSLFRAALHGGTGLLCLWLLNSVSGVTGLTFPINPVTVLISGCFGIPGMGLIALLELL